MSSGPTGKCETFVTEVAVSGQVSLVARDEGEESGTRAHGPSRSRFSNRETLGRLARSGLLVYRDRTESRKPGAIKSRV